MVYFVNSSFVSLWGISLSLWKNWTSALGNLNSISKESSPEKCFALKKRKEKNTKKTNKQKKKLLA